MAQKKRKKKLKKDSQLVVRVNILMRDQFIELCDELDTSAAREIRGFMKDFMKKHTVETHEDSKS